MRNHRGSGRISGHPCRPGARLASHQGPEYGRKPGLLRTPESGRRRGYRGFVTDGKPAWIDLLDATREQIEEKAPGDLHPRAIDLLVRPLEHTDEPRPTLESHGDYVFGVLLVPHFDQAHTDLYYQEIDLVLTRTCILTVRKTPGGPRAVRSRGRARDGQGTLPHRGQDRDDHLLPGRRGRRALPRPHRPPERCDRRPRGPRRGLAGGAGARADLVPPPRDAADPPDARHRPETPSGGSSTTASSSRARTSCSTTTSSCTSPMPTTSCCVPARRSTCRATWSPESATTTRRRWRTTRTRS